MDHGFTSSRRLAVETQTKNRGSKRLTTFAATIACTIPYLTQHL